MQIFDEILKVFLATLLLDHWKCLWKFSHINCRSSSIDRVGSNIGVRVDYRIIHDDCIISHHNSLAQNAISSYFDVISNRHSFDDGAFFDINIVSLIILKLPTLMGTYFNYLFWRLVGGFMITISERITNFPMLTLARSPLRMSLWCKMAWSQI